MMNKEALKELGEISFKIFNSKRRTAELLRWASLKDGRAEKIKSFLVNNPNASYGKINNEMARIVFEEMTR